MTLIEEHGILLKSDRSALVGTLQIFCVEGEWGVIDEVSGTTGLGTSIATAYARFVLKKEESCLDD